jgi:ketosteroid isomerase-like protein
MRRVAHLFALLVSLPALALAQTKPVAAGPKQALMDIEHRWAATSLKGDVATLETILAANWTGTNPEGAVDTRAQALERTKTSKFTKSEVSGMKVMVLNPTTAVVTGIWTGVGTGPKGEKIDTSERWTDVFVKQGGAWKCVASQSTTIKK